MPISWPRPFPWRSVLMAGAGVAVGLLFLGGLFLWRTYRHVSVQARPAANATPGIAEPTPDPLAPYNVALLGYGGGDHDGGKLTDTIIVAHIDPRQERIALISLPRDLWVSFPVDGETESHWKINAAYQIGADDRRYPRKLSQYTGPAGGGELAKYAISKVLGQPVQHFIALSFTGFERSIDVLGGVEVRVERSFDDYFYPLAGREDDPCGKSPEEIAALTATMAAHLLEQQFACRYEHLHFELGRQHMNGETALKYVRSRHSSQEGSDFSRSQRQKNLLLAVKEKVFAVSFLPKALPFISTLAGDLQTDLQLEDMQRLLEQQEQLRGYQIYGIALTDENTLRAAKSSDGQFILIPRTGQDDWPAVQEWLTQQLNAAAASPSAALSR